MSKPGFVPLPEVSEYSDKIVIGELGLPVGFDDERLHLHVGRTEGALRWGGIGRLTLSGYQGETTDYQYQVNGMNSGVGTAIGAKIASKAPTAETEMLDGSQDYYQFRWRHTNVRFNNAEISQRLQSGTKWEKRAFDPVGRAHLMDRAAKWALLCDIKQHEITEPNGLISEGLMFALMNATSFGEYTREMITETAQWLPGRIGSVVFYHAVHYAIIPKHRRGGPEKASMLFYGPKIDRALLASSFLARKLIVAK